MNGAFNLGEIFGIQFRLHYTWFVIFAYVTVSLAWLVFPTDYPDWNQVLYWLVGIVTSVLFFVSILIHELSHSLVGRANDIPIRSITLFIFGGVAQMTREARSAGAELKMAIAGPASSLVLAGLFYALLFFTRDTFIQVAAVALELTFINLALAAFNLLPGFPLDGGRVFRSILWRSTGNYQRATRIATRVGEGMGYLFILGGIIVAVLQPLGLDWFNGVWLAFIGWFLKSTASANYRQSQWWSALQGLTAAQLMTMDYPVVPSDTTVQQLVQDHVATGGRDYFYVTDGDRVVGVLALHNIKPIPRMRWTTVPLKDVMTSLANLKKVHPAESAVNLLQQMNADRTDQLVVVQEDRMVGLITRDHLMKVLRSRSELGI